MKTIRNSLGQRIVPEGTSNHEVGIKAKQAQAVVIVFTLCSLFMVMSFGMDGPVFAHLLKENSAGLTVLSMMTMVPHIAVLMLAPFIGGLEDRHGRYPFLLLTFAGLVLANIGYLFVHSTTAYISIRFFQGVIHVGAAPAMMGILADLVPEQQRTRQISFIMAGYAGGMTLGPVTGGFLLQRWGAVAPFSVSAFLNLIAFYLAYTMVPRTPPLRLYTQEVDRDKALLRKKVELFVKSLLLPLTFFGGLLVLDFVIAFGRTFVEPQLAMYLTKALKFTPVQFGLLMSGHGLAMAIGQLLLSRFGDRIGKREVVALGFLVQAGFTFSLLLTHQFAILFLTDLFSGIGGGLVLPLLNVCYLESAAPDYRSSIIGVKEAVGALGCIGGSLVVILGSQWLSPQRAFTIGGCIVMGAGLFALLLWRFYSLRVETGEHFIE